MKSNVYPVEAECVMIKQTQRDRRAEIYILIIRQFAFSTLPLLADPLTNKMYLMNLDLIGIIEMKFLFMMILYSRVKE